MMKTWRPAAPVVFFAALLISSCGGGGGGTVAGSNVSISGVVQVPGPSGRAAQRLLAGAKVTLGLNGETLVYVFADVSSAAFQFSELQAGARYRIEAESGALRAVMHVDASNGPIVRDVTEKTTAESIVYERLRQAGETEKMAPFGQMEDSPLLEDLIAALTAAYLDPDSFDYAALSAGAEADAILSRLNEGARLDDLSAPQLDLASPVEGSVVTDEAFRAEDFQLTFSYSDETRPDPDGDGFSVSITIDGGEPLEIGSHFNGVSQEADFQSSGDAALYEDLRTLFQVFNNTQDRTAVVVVSIQDISGNTATTSKSFTIRPAVLNPPD